MGQRLQVIVASAAIMLPINIWIAINYGTQPVLSSIVTGIVVLLVVTLWYRLFRPSK